MLIHIKLVDYDYRQAVLKVILLQNQYNNTKESVMGTAKSTNHKVIIWTTLIGGFISSLVKWGSEVNTPPRMPGEISPPGANIDAWLG